MRLQKPAVLAAITYANEALAKASPSDHVGDLLYWTFALAFTIPSTTARTIWISSGLDPDADLPAPPDLSSAFLRAVNLGKVRAPSLKARVVECAPTADGSKRVAIVGLEINGHVEGKTTGLVVLNADTTSVDIEQEDDTGLAAFIEAQAQALADRYTQDDIRIAIMRVIARWHACQAKDGLYFVPSVASPTLAKLRNAVASLSAGTVHLVPLLRSNPDSLLAAQSAVSATIESECSKLTSEVAEWQKSFTGRPSTIERRIEEAEAFRARAKLLLSVVQGSYDGLDSTLDGIQSSMKTVLGLAPAKKNPSELTPEEAQDKYRGHLLDAGVSEDFVTQRIKDIISGSYDPSSIKSNRVRALVEAFAPKTS